MRRGWPARNTPLSTCYHAEFDRCWSNRTNVHMEIRQLSLAPCITPLWSLKVTWTNTDRSAIYDFPLLVHSNHCFRDKRLFRSKSQIYSTLCILRFCWRGYPWKFILALVVKTTWVMPLLDGPKLWRLVHLLIHNDTMWQLDRQTETVSHHSDAR